MTRSSKHNPPRRDTARFYAAVFAVVALALASSGCGSADAGGSSDELAFAAIPAEQNIDPELEYKNLIALLEKKTGRKVKFVRSTDYNAVIEGMVSGKVDIAEFGPLSYVLARNNGADITPVGVMVEKDAPATYRSYGSVPAASQVKDLAGFKGKKVCFVDPSSTSGYLFPSAALLALGIDPKTGVTPVMAGGHDNSVTSVVSGQCEAGFAYDSMVDKVLPGKQAIKPGDVRVVWKSEPIPNSPVAIRNGLPDDVKKAITEALLTDANPDRLVALGICPKMDGCQLVSDPDIWGFKPTDDATFNPVREVCKATRNEKCAAKG